MRSQSQKQSWGTTPLFTSQAESHVDRSVLNSRVFVDTNVLGTQTLLDEALQASIPRFVHISTDEVYGSIDEGSWDEKQPLLPNSPYAASKASS